MPTVDSTCKCELLLEEMHDRMMYRQALAAYGYVGSSDLVVVMG